MLALSRAHQFCIYLVAAKNLPYENLTPMYQLKISSHLATPPVRTLPSPHAIFITSSIHLAPSPRAFTHSFYCLQGFSKLSGRLRSEVGPWLIESAGSRIFRPFSRRNPAIQTQRWREGRRGFGSKYFPLNLKIIRIKGPSSRSTPCSVFA